MEVSTKFCIRWRVATTSAWSTPGWTSTAWARTSGAGWTGRRPARTGATLAVRTRPRRRRRRGGSSAKETRIYSAAAEALLPFILFVPFLCIFVRCLVLSLPGLWKHVLDLMKERLHPADMCRGHFRMYHKYHYHSMYPFEMFSNVDHLDARQQYIIHHRLSIMYHILPLAYQNIESLHKYTATILSWRTIYRVFL